MRRLFTGVTALALALSMTACSHEDSKKDAEAAKCATSAPASVKSWYWSLRLQAWTVHPGESSRG